MENKKIKILMIEDNPGDADYIREILSERKGTSFSIKCVDCLKKALEKLNKGRYDAVLLDLGLPDSHGMETLHTVVSRFPDITIIVLTGLEDEVLGNNIVQQGAQDYLIKGQVDSNLLTRSIRHAMERKGIEKELKQSNEIYRNMIELAPDGITTLDPEGKITSCNSPFLNLSGFSRDEIVGKHFSELPKLKARDIHSWISMFTSIRKGKIPPPLEIEWIHKNGTPHWGEARISLMKKGGNITGIQLVTRDITERKKAEIRSEQQQRITKAINTIFKKALTCEKEEDLARTCLEVAQELVGARFGFFGEVNTEGKFDALAISNHGWDECTMPESDATGIIKGTEIYGMKFLPPKDGKSRIFNDPSNHLESVGIPDGHSKINCLLAVPLIYGDNVIGQIGLGNKEGGYNLDDQEAIEVLSVAMVEALMRKRAESALLESEEKLRRILESSPDAITVTDLCGNIIECNQATVEMQGFSSKDQIIGVNAFDYIAKRDQTRAAKVMRETLDQGQSKHMEYNLLTRDGREFPAEMSASVIKDQYGNPTSFIVTTKDITERKHAEEELIQSEKLAGIGTLASGIAHEVNNPLAGIMGYAEIIQEEEDLEKIREYTQKIMKNTKRASDIVRWLSRYSREAKDTNIRDVNLEEVMNDAMEALVHTRRSSDVDVVKDFHKTPSIKGNRSELLQIFVNLMNNAVDAMPRGGRLNLTSAVGNDIVEVKVSDSGVGIPKDKMSRIFDPFFTTKEAGKGTGLGLYVINMLVKKHHGTIEVESEEGVGTTFTMRFPVLGVET